MKLKKIIDYDSLQAYSIINPSKKFKLMHPFKYIFVVNVNGRTEMLNLNKIPAEFAYVPIIGYVFTYDKKLPDFFKSMKNNKYTNYGSTFPSCLDQYFTSSEGDTKKIDLILSCTGRNKEVPVCFKDSLIIRCNSEELIGDDPKKASANIMNVLNAVLAENEDRNTEEWLQNILQNAPSNDNEFPLRYPKTIDDSLFKRKTKVDKSNVFVEYDFRASSYDEENKIVSALEEGFEDMNSKVEVFNTYNDILPKIKEALDKKGLKYRELTPHSIETTLKNIRSIDVEFQLTDFI